MVDEQKTEVNPETLEKQEEEVKQEEVKQEEPKFTKDDIANIMAQRVAKEKAKIYKELGVDNLDEVKSVIEKNKQAKEKYDIEKGNFEKVIKDKSVEWQKEKEKLVNQLKEEKITKQVINSASKHSANNPEQVLKIIRESLKYTDDGSVEVLDKSGVARYNKDGNLLSIDEYVQEFLTQNTHFQSATPKGSASVGNVGKVDARPFNIADLDMNNPDDRKKYAEYRKSRTSQPTVINLNKQ